MHRKFIIAGLFPALLAIAMPQASFAADDAAQRPTNQQDIDKIPPSATFELTGKQFRLLVGGAKGKGIIKFNGQDYPFSIQGVSAGGYGVNEVKATGEVRYLNKIEDFAGTYTGVTMGTTIGVGMGRGSFQNGKGVLVSVKSKSEGLASTLGLSSVTVTLDKK